MSYLICRYCGRLITPEQDQEAIQLHEYNGPAVTEYFHSGCKDSLPEAISNPRPEGFRRLQACVVSIYCIRVVIDGNDFYLSLNEYRDKLVEIRKSSCIYFKGMIQVDIPDELYLIYSEQVSRMPE